MTNKIIPRNLTALAAYSVPGNPPVTRPESGVGNCYPGLEYDHRNLDRRFFPGLVFDFVSQEEATNIPRRGALLVAVDTTDPELRTSDPRYAERARALAAKLGSLDSAGSDPFYLSEIVQDGRRIRLSDEDGAPLDGMVVWRLVRGLEPAEVDIVLERRAAPPAGAAPGREELAGWRRRFTSPGTGVISLALQPGELTQSLCSPWSHDFRDCACTYWASNHPDIVLGESPRTDVPLPSGYPDDPARAGTRVDWQRADRAFARSAVASPTQRADRPFQISHYEINERWQELAVVLEGREIGSVYDPRIHDTANPYRSPEELADELEKLAHLEHVLALMYLYARYSVLQPEEVTVADSWPTLKEDVYFVRREILITAVSEMQHMRWVNQLLWELAEAGLIKRRPPVVEPGREIPGAGPLSTRPAELMPLLPAVLKTFVDVELPSGYIDGRYARVVATLRSGYPSSLYQLASRIVTDGEEHYSRFRRVQQTLNRYGKYTPYLRDIELGSPADPNVATALAIYAKIKSSLRAAYESGDLEQAADVVRARELMHKLDEAAEALARKGVGVPFFPQK